ncbi:unnamed protein product [Calicophoron daubneyi]|uniref:Pinin/SDK/MemA protein domain-containing protein n=1 Tax=Calicophoron daubneyi TaxID=300641 RepID=A0AAV2TJM4_CALDB
MTTVDRVDVLRQNLEIAREQLKSVENDIKRITGRDPSDDRHLRKIFDTSLKRSGAKLPIKPSLLRNAFESLKTDRQKLPEDDLQVSIASSVVRVGESRSRSDASKVLRQSDKERGRRMLGILQSTLNQFKAESQAAIAKPQMAKRLQVDAKVEARAEEEKESLRRERADLFRARREQQIEVNLLQQKMRMAKEFEAWKTEMQKMAGFCRTEQTPHIYFRPKIPNDESNRRVLLTTQAINDLISHRQKRLEFEFDETASSRRRFMVASSNLSGGKDQKTSDADRWSPEHRFSDSLGAKALPSVIGAAAVRSESVSSKSNRRQTDTAHSEAGELSDASENLAMEGDEEPLLMEEEHVASVMQSSGIDIGPHRVTGSAESSVKSVKTPNSTVTAGIRAADNGGGTAEESVVQYPLAEADTRTVHINQNSATDLPGYV